jgi:hypothetical protein
MIPIDWDSIYFIVPAIVYFIVPAIDELNSEFIPNLTVTE